MLQHINLPVWAKDKATFDAVLVQFGLAEVIDSEVVYHRGLRGHDEPGALTLPNKDSAPVLDEDGNHIGYSANLPGFYYNLRGIYHEPKRGVPSLVEVLSYAMDAETGEYILDEDGNPIIMPQTEIVKDEDGNDVEQLLNIAYRCNLPQRVLFAGGEIVDKKGFEGDPKAPKHLAIKDGKGDVIFRVFDPDDINSPANTFA